MYLEDIFKAVLEPLNPAFNPNIITAASIKSSFLGGTYSSLFAAHSITDGSEANILISPETFDVLNNHFEYSSGKPDLAIIGPAIFPATTPPV